MYAVLHPKEETEEFHFMKRGNMKEGKFVPSLSMEAELEVKSNLFLGPVHWKTVAVVERE